MDGIVAYTLTVRWPDQPGAIVMLDAAVVTPEPMHAVVAPLVERLRGPGYAAGCAG